jgi:uncharacterized protein (TIGR02147 family)
MEIFKCGNHFEFLNEVFKNKERGFLSRVAEVLQTHPSYVSRVLNGANNLTLDQGFTLGKWLEFDEAEQEFLSLLIQKDRAATKDYREALERRLESLRERKRDLGKDFQVQYSPNPSEALYYSSWIYSAIHILLTIPQFNTVKKISEALKISPSEAETGLRILEAMGAASLKGEHWSQTKSHVFISNSNPLAQCYHSSWSHRLNSFLSVGNPEHVRYTGVHSLSKSDWKKLRVMIRDFLKSINSTVEPSKEETLVAIRIDAGELL